MSTNVFIHCEGEDIRVKATGVFDRIELDLSTKNFTGVTQVSFSEAQANEIILALANAVTEHHTRKRLANPRTPLSIANEHNRVPAEGEVGS